MSSHSLDRGVTEIENQVYLDAVRQFADQLNQFPANRDHVSRLERDISKLALAAMAASSKISHGEPILADDGLLWHKSAELFDNVFVCHRQVDRGSEFAVIEQFPSGTNEIWTKGRNAIDVLNDFTREQRHALQILTEEISAQVKEFLTEKYPDRDLTQVAEDFVRRFSQADRNGSSRATSSE